MGGGGGGGEHVRPSRNSILKDGFMVNNVNYVIFRPTIDIETLL